MLDCLAGSSSIQQLERPNPDVFNSNFWTQVCRNFQGRRRVGGKAGKSSQADHGWKVGVSRRDGIG